MINADVSIFRPHLQNQCIIIIVAFDLIILRRHNKIKIYNKNFRKTII